MSNELKVGVVVLIAIVVAGFFMMRMDGSLLLGAPEAVYSVRVQFDSISGMAADAPVLVAGLRVGRIASITLTDEGRAEVTIRIEDPDVVLRSDATASIASLGVLGEKYLELTAGSLSSPAVVDGGLIQPGVAVSIDQMVAVLNGIAANVQETTQALSNVFGSEAGETRMQAILQNTEQVTRDIGAMVAINRETIATTMGNVEDLTASLAASLPAMVEDMRTLVLEANAMVTANEDNIGGAVEDVRALISSLDRSAAEIEEIMQKINSGDGTASQLINTSDTIDKANAALDTIDDSLAAFDTFFNRVGQTQFSFGLRSEWYASDEATKNYFGFRLGLGASGDRRFILELVDDNVGLPEVTTTVTEELDQNGNVTDVRIERELSRSDAFKLSAQFAAQINNWQLRGGLIESEAGVGIDYAPGTGRLRFTLEGWDFGRNPDPHIKFGGSFDVYDRMFVILGGDDLLSTDFRQFYVGAGFRFR